ncbi:MAG: type I DNA topoisomerase [Candidatus Andersenbacteria bacterium]
MLAHRKVSTIVSSLVIVESPTKAKTIGKFLGRGYTVKSSFGHVRDLPKSKMGIDIEHGFEPDYVIPVRAKKVITDLRAQAKKADTIYLATDEDREGEAIGWHLMTALKLAKDKTKRIVFHEITKRAIDEALKNPRDLDAHLIDAQQARRVLDRLVGYELSPFLWKKIKYGLSAGRVQSAAVRLIVDREREIEKFKADEYWTIEAELEKKGVKPTVAAHLVKRAGKTLEKLAIKNKATADEVTAALKGASFEVSEISQKEKSMSPSAPFTTSTLQQDASRRLGYSAKQTMMLAQQLYEGIELGTEGSVGLISYMRTDSVNLAEQALAEAKEVIGNEFGSEFTAAAPRRYKTKSKSAQEAHEAIRPTSFTRTPESIKQYLEPRQHKLYDLIWRRALASQMPDARFNSTTLDITAGEFVFRANGLVITFAGFQKALGPAASSKETELPKLAKGDKLVLVGTDALKGVQHFTQPPARYSDATLVKAMEEFGIGRPSTYAPTISTIQDRGYVEKVEKRFKPTEIGRLVDDVLVKHFPKIVDLTFTSQMEEDLDLIAEGKKEWVPIIKAFYDPFHANLKAKDKAVTKEELTTEKSDEKCEKCGKPMVIKMGRFGKFLACTGYPDCKTTRPLKAEREAQAKMEQELSGEKCPECGSAMVIKRGRFGTFLGCSTYPKCKGIKRIEKKTGAKCPECGKGEIIEKRSRKGRTFYACNKYPECEFALWNKPTGKTCPKCKSLVVYAAKGQVRCSSKECDYKAETEQPA